MESHQYDTTRAPHHAILAPVILFLGLVVGCVDLYSKHYFHSEPSYVKLRLRGDHQTPANNKSVTESSISYDDEENRNWPEVAWLMSFPNSGTSFTMRLVQSVSNKSVASNYNEIGKSQLNKEGRSIPIQPNFDNGPYVHHNELELPKTYILTKTHCDRGILQNESSFGEGCCTGKRIVPDNRDGHSIQEPFQYNTSIVKKVIHLIRDPFDNIVSRFHLECNKHSKRNDTQWMENYPRNKDGFQAWCESLKLKRKEQNYIRDHFPEAAKISAPCQSEFYKYVLWHNRVFELIKKLPIPVHILHYEDYQTNYNSAVSKLFDFLELEQLAEPASEFLMNDYTDHYSNEQRDAVIGLIRAISSKETKKELDSSYFSSY